MEIFFVAILTFVDENTTFSKIAEIRRIEANILLTLVRTRIFSIVLFSIYLLLISPYPGTKLNKNRRSEIINKLLNCDTWTEIFQSNSFLFSILKVEIHKRFDSL